MNSDIDEWMYRHYVANSLKWGVERTGYKDTLYELMHPAPVETRSAEEITADVLKKTGITLKD